MYSKDASCMISKLFSPLALCLLLALACNSPVEKPDVPVTPVDTVILEDKEPPIPTPEDTIAFEERLADYESKDRVFWQKPDLVVDRLGDLSTKTVADVGAGSGYFARRLAYKAKKVIAIDIDPNFISFMDSIKLVELPRDIQQKFETRLATFDDPKLEKGEADIVLMVNTYLYIQDRVDYMRRLKEGLAPGGKVVIIDYKKKRIPLTNPPQRIRVPLFEVEDELFEAGYSRVISDDTSLDYQYIIVARN
ncbi:MAG: class I SAM-dependent methyltransferase [Saprospiraceae bacterium]|nr:class I SAM-dependent methyltransferase [Saprospiraceae bacterium]